MKLSDYEKLIDGKVCRWCLAPLPAVVQSYPHDGGRPVEGMDGLQWLSVHCDRCEYDWALWKLGIPRPHKPN